jgi:hypothetical protein
MGFLALLGLLTSTISKIDASKKADQYNKDTAAYNQEQLDIQNRQGAAAHAEMLKRERDARRAAMGRAIGYTYDALPRYSDSFVPGTLAPQKPNTSTDETWNALGDLATQYGSSNYGK